LDLKGRKWQDAGKYEELHDLYASPNKIRTIKLRRMRWAGHGRDEKCIQNFGQKT